MRLSARTILGVLLAMVAFLISSHVLAQVQSQGDQTSGAEQESVVAIAGLADIGPLESKLSGRLKALENRVTGLLDVPEFERQCAVIEANLTRQAGQLQRLKDSKDYRLNDLVQLRETTR